MMFIPFKMGVSPQINNHGVNINPGSPLVLPSKQQPPGKQSHRAVSNGMVRPRTGNVRPQGEFGSNRGVMQPVMGKIAVSQATNWRVLCVAGGNSNV